MSLVILYVMHIFLFGVKLGLVINLAIVLYKDKYRFIWCVPLFLFSIVSMLTEVWFIYNFFQNITLYYYEYISIFNEMLFTILVTYYITKEVDYGKN